MVNRNDYGWDRDERDDDEAGFQDVDMSSSRFGRRHDTRRRGYDQRSAGPNRWAMGRGSRGDWEHADDNYRQRGYTTDYDLGRRDYGWQRGPGYMSEQDRWRSGRGYGRAWEEGPGEAGYRGQSRRPGMGEWGQQGFRGDFGHGDERGYGQQEPASARYGWEERGPYAGRGPRGYQRSNERIAEEVNERLTQHGWLDASGLEVSVENGIVTLSGEVDDYRAKRMAEDAALDVSGVGDVRNEIRVRRQGGDTESQTR
jgi:hypothetical protein